jgi:hypothetical protein
MKSPELLGFSAHHQKQVVTFRDATKREHDDSSRGKSGDSDHCSFEVLWENVSPRHCRHPSSRTRDPEVGTGELALAAVQRVGKPTIGACKLGPPGLPPGSLSSRAPVSDSKGLPEPGCPTATRALRLDLPRSTKGAVRTPVIELPF